MAVFSSLGRSIGRLVNLPVASGVEPQPGPATAAGDDPTAAAVKEPYSIRLAFSDAAADGQARCLISFLGPLEEHGADMIDAAVESARDAGQVPVAVICELRPDLATTRDYPIDFLPMRAHVPILDRWSYDRYVRRRWDIMLLKWDCSHHIQLGVDLDEFIAAQKP